MINAFQSFFDISNNWEMVFYAFDQNLKDEQFLCELFNITNIILKNIINKNIDDDKLKTFEHLAIEELAKICKKCAHAEMFLLRWIYAFDISLRNCNPVRYLFNLRKLLKFHNFRYFRFRMILHCLRMPLITLLWIISQQPRISRLFWNSTEILLL